MENDELVANYTTLAAERGTTLEQIASEHEHHDPRLAAMLRAAASGTSDEDPQDDDTDEAPEEPEKDDDADFAQAPKGRRSKASSTTEA